MNNFSFLILPALLGLIAGAGHGVVAHYADLPMSLGDQFLRPLQSYDPYRPNSYQ